LRTVPGGPVPAGRTASGADPWLAKTLPRPAPGGKVDGHQEGSTMAKGQVKTDKKNKPKLSTKEKQEKKKEKQAKK
jgi:hypothetical protein